MEHTTNEIAISRRWTLCKNEKLGEGAFGKVYRGRETKTGMQVAIKKVEFKKIQVWYPSYDLIQLMKEIQIMIDASDLGH